MRRSALGDLRSHSRGEERKRCIEALTVRLRDEPSQQLVAELALCLADIGAEEALPELLRRQEGLSPRARAGCVVAIGELACRGDSLCYPVLRSAWASRDPELRFQTLIAAGRVFEAAQLQPWLMEALGDPDPQLRHIACRILEERYLGVPDAEKGDVSRSQPRPELMAALRERLADDDRRVRAAAAVALAPLDVGDSRQVLAEVLSSPGPIEPDDEQAAVELCGRLRITSARAALIKRMKRGWWRGPDALQFPVLTALALLQDAEAKRRILTELRSPRSLRRAQAVVAAGLARLEDARPELVRLRSRARAGERSAVDEALQALDQAKHSL